MAQKERTCCPKCYSRNLGKPQVTSGGNHAKGGAIAGGVIGALFGPAGVAVGTTVGTWVGKGIGAIRLDYAENFYKCKNCGEEFSKYYD